MDFERIWARIEEHAGESFVLKLGGEFTYIVKSGQLLPSRTPRWLAKSQFEKAFVRMPIQTLTELRDLQGASYIHAILIDPRVSDDS